MTVWRKRDPARMFAVVADHVIWFAWPSPTDARPFVKLVEFAVYQIAAATAEFAPRDVRTGRTEESFAETTPMFVGCVADDDFTSWSVPDPVHFYDDGDIDDIAAILRGVREHAQRAMGSIRRRTDKIGSIDGR